MDLFFLLTFDHLILSFSMPGDFLLHADIVYEKLQRLQVVLSPSRGDKVSALCEVERFVHHSWKLQNISSPLQVHLSQNLGPSGHGCLGSCPLPLSRCFVLFFFFYLFEAVAFLLYILTILFLVFLKINCWWRFEYIFIYHVCRLCGFFNL